MRNGKQRTPHQALKAVVRLDSFAARPLADMIAAFSVVPMHADSAAPGRVGGSAHPANRGVPVLQGCHYWADAESNFVLDATSSTPSSSGPRPYIPRAPLSQEKLVTLCFPASAQLLRISIHKQRLAHLPHTRSAIQTRLFVLVNMQFKALTVLALSALAIASPELKKRQSPSPSTTENPFVNSVTQEIHLQKLIVMIELRLLSLASLRLLCLPLCSSSALTTLLSLAP